MVATTSSGDLHEAVHRVTGEAEVVLHGDFRGVLDLFDVQAVKRGQRGSRHRAGTADFRLAAAFGAGDAGVGADDVADHAGHGQRIQNLVLREAAVAMHVIKHRRKHAAAAAGRGGHDDVFIGVLLADRIRIGSDDAVHGHIRALVVAALVVKELGLARDAEAARQDAIGLEAPVNGVLHGLPHLVQVHFQGRVLHAVDQLRQGDALFLAEVEDLGEILLRVHLAFILRRLPLDADRAAADAENALSADLFAVLICDEQHGVGVGQIGLLEVIDDLGARQAVQDRLAGSVAFTGEGEGTVERDPEGIRLRITRPENACGVIGSDRMRAGRPVADLIYTLDTFHVSFPSLRNPFSADCGKGVPCSMFPLCLGQAVASAGASLPSSLVMVFISMAMAPSPVTLQAVPKESCAI